MGWNGEGGIRGVGRGCAGIIPYCAVLPDDFGFLLFSSVSASNPLGSRSAPSDWLQYFIDREMRCLPSPLPSSIFMTCKTRLINTVQIVWFLTLWCCEHLCTNPALCSVVQYSIVHAVVQCSVDTKQYSTVCCSTVLQYSPVQSRTVHWTDNCLMVGLPLKVTQTQTQTLSL
jgi:hypothetical protein